MLDGSLEMGIQVSPACIQISIFFCVWDKALISVKLGITKLQRVLNWSLSVVFSTVGCILDSPRGIFETNTWALPPDVLI